MNMYNKKVNLDPRPMKKHLVIVIGILCSNSSYFWRLCCWNCAA